MKNKREKMRKIFVGILALIMLSSLIFPTISSFLN